MGRFKDWLGEARDWVDRPDPLDGDLGPDVHVVRRSGDETHPAHLWWTLVLSSENPFQFVKDWMWAQGPTRLIAGLSLITGLIALTDRDTPILGVGGVGKGKSSMLLMVNLIFAHGAAFIHTTRDEAYYATGLLRATVGDLWTLNPHGVAMPGTQLVRWSLLYGCDDLTYALETGARLVRAEADMGAAGRREIGDHPFFQEDAGQTLGVAFYYCATRKAPKMALRTMAGIIARRDRRRLIDVVADMKQTNNPSDSYAADILGGIIDCAPAQRDGVLATARQAIAWWMTPQGEANEDDPNFDFDKFVRGHDGRFDTIYSIKGTVSGPYLRWQMEFIHRLIEAQKRHAEKVYDRTRRLPTPFTLLLDELAAAPLPNLFSENLAHFRDRGVNVVLLTQAYRQLKDIYRLETFGEVHGLAGNIVQFRGCTDHQVNQAIAALIDPMWVKNESMGYGPDGRGNERWLPSIGEQLVPGMEPSHVAAGHPHADVQMIIRPNANVGWLNQTPYFRGVWLRIIVQTLELIGTDYPLLPLPDLARNGDYRFLQEVDMADRFYDLAMARWQSTQTSHEEEVDVQ